MIEFFFGEGSEIEAELENPYDKLRAFGKSPSWLMAITASVMGGGVCLTRKRVKKIGTSTVFDLESEPVSLRPRVFSSLNIRSIQTQSYEFSCSAEQQKKIAEIVTILNNNSAIDMAWNGSVAHLRALEDQLDDVPPLHFLWTVFSDQKLKKMVQKIFQSRLKYLHQDGFLTGIKKGMEKSSWSEIEPYLDPWAKSLGTTKAAVAPLIQKKNWRGLVDHLLK